MPHPAPIHKKEDAIDVYGTYAELGHETMQSFVWALWQQGYTKFYYWPDKVAYRITQDGPGELVWTKM